MADECECERSRRPDDALTSRQTQEQTSISAPSLITPFDTNFALFSAKVTPTSSPQSLQIELIFRLRSLSEARFVFWPPQAMPSPVIAETGAGSSAAGGGFAHKVGAASHQNQHQYVLNATTSSSSYASSTTTTSNTMTPKSVIVAPASKVSQRLNSSKVDGGNMDHSGGHSGRGRGGVRKSYWRRRNRKRKVFANRDHNRTRPYPTPSRNWDLDQQRICPIQDQEKPFAPDNTTQFLMEDHNVREPEFEEIRKLLRLHQDQGQQSQSNSDLKDPSVEQQDSFSTRDGSDSDDFYSSPDDEQDFQQRQFSEVYEHVHTERLSSMKKTDLVQEYILLEEKAEDMEKKLKVTQAMLTEIKHRTGTATPPVSAVMSVLDIARLKAEIKRLTEENDRLRVSSHVSSSHSSSSNSSTTNTTAAAAPAEPAVAIAEVVTEVADSSSPHMDTNAIPTSTSPPVTS